MTKKQINKRINELNIWKRDGERAPHKPLLLLLALARLNQDYDRLLSFKSIQEPLKNLLMNFGPPRKSFHPLYPFWYLKNDGLWEIPGSDELKHREGKKEPLKSELIKHNIKGGFPVQIFKVFKNDRKLFENVVKNLLDAHFPQSLHEDILNEIGIDLYSQIRRKKRNPNFRYNVIQAYEHQCAICGCDIKLGHLDMVLEAAHIKWFQAGGPDEVQNGIALCVFHHKAFDRGAIGLSDDLKVIISADAYGHSNFADWFFSFKGQKVRKPISDTLLPKYEFINWHRRQVFRLPQRD